MKRLKLCGEKWQKKGFYSNFVQILFLANSFWHLTSFGSNGKITSMPTKFCSDNTNSLIVKLNSTGNFARWHSILNIRTASKKVCPQRLKGKIKKSILAVSCASGLCHYERCHEQRLLKCIWAPLLPIRSTELWHRAEIQAHDHDNTLLISKAPREAGIFRISFCPAYWEEPSNIHVLCVNSFDPACQ